MRERAEFGAGDWADLIAQLGDAVVVLDCDGTIIGFNPVAERLYQYSAPEVIGRPVTALVPQSVHDDAQRMVAAVSAGATRCGYALARAKDGSTLELQLTASPLRSADGETIGIVSLLRDVAAERLRERQLTFLTRMLDESDSLAVIGSDRAGRISMYNRGAERLLGYSEQEAVGRLLATDLGDPEEMRQRAAHRGVSPGAAVYSAAVDQIQRDQQITLVRKDGSKVKTLTDLRAVLDPLGAVEGFIGVARDLTEVQHAEAERVRAEERFRVAFEHAPIGLAITGLDGGNSGRWLQANPELTRMLGYSLGELDGELIDTHTYAADRFATPDLLAQLCEQRIELEKRFLHRDGHAIWAQVTSTPVPNPEGGPAFYSITQILDISARRHFEAQLHYLAEHDTMTGLLNRASFEAELARQVAAARGEAPGGALLVLDLDGLKVVNDRFGHATGDELLIHIAGLLLQSVRHADFVGRLGGDEFAVLVPDCDALAAREVAEHLLEVMRRLAVLPVGAASARVTASIGVARFDGDLAVTAEAVAGAADIAMYQAKADGRDSYAVFHPGATRHQQYLGDRESLFTRLRRALDEGRFVLYAQPIVPICARSIPRFELLLRMHGEQGRLVSPAEFLVSAEQFDLIGEIDRWVIRNAVTMLHRQQELGNDFSLSVNVSGRTMGDLSFASDLAALLERNPVEPGRLVVEVTETAAIVNIGRARELASQLRTLGCQFALDDFGAGFSSFHYLKHLDFDFLKIDGEFITKLTRTSKDQLLVRAVVQIARGLGTRTVAEFVGDQETVELLRSLGVDYGQGYHLGRPAPVEEQLPRIAAKLAL